MMTFTQALVKSGYYFQPETGAFCKEDSNGNLHSYRQSNQNINVWNYQRWVDFRGQDVLIRSKRFTVN